MVFFWILIYGLFFSLSEIISSLFSWPWLAPLVMSIYIGLLILWIIKTGQHVHIGLTLPKTSPREFIFFIPFGILPLLNLFLTDASPVAASSVLLMLCICTTEELFFRGFLFSFLMQKIGYRSITAVSLIFSLFHLSNLLAGWTLDYTVLQLFAAFAVSLYYCTVRLYCGSLFPCVAAHILTNLTAGNHFPIHQPGRLLIWFLCMLVYPVCSLLLYRKISVKTEDNS